MFRSTDLDESDEPQPPLTGHLLRSALDRVADTLRDQGHYIEIVAVGGAVNTLLLGSRETTTDVDFLYYSVQDDMTVKDLLHAAQSVARSAGIRDEQWLNNHTESFIQKSVLGSLYQESVTQNRIVFDAGGLKVYAAAWPFAFVQKVIRNGSTQQKSYDIDDAVAYLKEMKNGADLSFGTVQGWAKKYKLPAPQLASFEEIIGKYRQELDEWQSL
ncbi:hypothetical protein R3P38DRAFT_2558153 [Favolaschia claudopus]|uniref:Uncharacterized protein n=1 Tax=Favolaschia claudopus TaxID=2862362 RepID=A0AAW0A728_9AGAR